MDLPMDTSYISATYPLHSTWTHPTPCLTTQKMSRPGALRSFMIDDILKTDSISKSQLRTTIHKPTPLVFIPFSDGGRVSSRCCAGSRLSTSHSDFTRLSFDYRISASRQSSFSEPQSPIKDVSLGSSPVTPDPISPTSVWTFPKARSDFFGGFPSPMRGESRNSIIDPHNNGHPFVWAHILHRPPPKRKGGQIRFTNNQTTELEKVFETQKYLSPPERKKMASVLRLTERQVKTWFQNRRAKWRRIKQDGDSPTSQSIHESKYSDTEEQVASQEEHGESDNCNAVST
ncbi:hematopoietically-expressed homeobox protein HHEX-like isoform X2 [Limulus polyphemus]|uniref:Hematopoietically-expressed homeobox protein HHEX-like isoform X2 n=1 Tax=Limulus polyphemus TaxID=6850 RepID=A0ABM1BVR8_LIMPO|nr:hematopoietically-expressed homeobox protein HHEX-like isoform X2 [Limulus polyphemus]